MSTMSCAIDRDALLASLVRVSGASDRSSKTLPILGSALLRTTASGLSVAATDLYLAASDVAPASVATEGGIAVPLKDAIDRVKLLGPGLVAVDVEGTRTTFRAGRRSYSLWSVAADEFPTLPATRANATSIRFRADVLRGVLADARHAISADETRPHLNSAMLQIDGATLRVVTTDGHRLAKVEREGLWTGKGEASVLIPEHAVDELCKMLAPGKRGSTLDPDAFVTMPVLVKSTMMPEFPGSKNMVERGDYSTLIVERGRHRLSIRPVAAAFPSWRQVIPQVSARNATLDAAAFRSALKSVSVASSDRTGGVTLRFNDGGTELLLTAASPEKGEASETIDAHGATGFHDSFDIGANAKYLLDAIEGAEGDVSIGVSGNLDPIVIRRGAEHVEVVMPMRILRGASTDGASRKRGVVVGASRTTNQPRTCPPPRPSPPFPNAPSTVATTAASRADDSPARERPLTSRGAP